MRVYDYWTIREVGYLNDNYLILSMKDLGNYLNRSESSIKNKLQRLNLNKNHLWTDKEIKCLKNNYNYKYRNKDDLIKKLGRSWQNIKMKASELNLTGISINDDFFKEWTKKMAYTFGLWIADGWMAKDKNTISFVSKDYDLLKIVKSNLKSDHKIYENKNNIFKLTFNNKILYNDLLKLGGTPKKSLTIQFPKVPDEFLHHFIRGEFDGDGSNFTYKKGKYRYFASNFTGNVDFLNTLKDKIKEHVEIDSPCSCSCGKNCNPRIKQIRYNGKKAIKLGDYIYKDSDNLRLERKFKIYDDMRKEYIKKLERKN